MTDALAVYTANSLVYTGKGQVIGFIFSTSAASSTVVLYDNTSAAAPKLVEVTVSAGHPAILFFNDRTAPRFTTGLYVAVPANTQVTLWSYHQV
jgi:hypothetical protein